MNRWVLVLSCTHRLLSDDVALEGDKDYCPSCGHTRMIVEVYKHRDEDI